MNKNYVTTYVFVYTLLLVHIYAVLSYPGLSNSQYAPKCLNFLLLINFRELHYLKIHISNIYQ